MFASDLLQSVSAFFFNDTATTEIYTLSLHDALPISRWRGIARGCCDARVCAGGGAYARDRKSTRLNSSHMSISYAVFCLKKKIDVHAWRNPTGSMSASDVLQSVTAQFDDFIVRTETF